jgi:hypothetical protein
MGEPKKCPKCSKPMKMVDTILAIPALLDSKHDRKTDMGQNISLKNAFPIEAHVCLKGCRYVEFYASY